MPDGFDLADLFEPGAFSCNGDPAMVSIAISLRRIADDLLRERVEITTVDREIEIPPLPADDVAPPSLDRQLWAEFTPCERRVAALLAQGMKNKEIGRRLGSAEGTIRVHMANLMKKAGVTTRTAFVARLYRLGVPS